METPFPVLLVAILIGTPPWAYGDTPDTSRPPTPIHIQDLPLLKPSDLFPPEQPQEPMRK